uniref:Cryptochrome n=1 Tax=Suberites domuncula TaxID=55567 RepID=D5G3Q3_SUBDO|nr:cryptochrome [Suberites domuncula]
MHCNYPLATQTTFQGQSIPDTTVHWFRLDALRLHDNPAFVDAVKTDGNFKAVFIIDPWFNANYNNGGPQVNVWRFLLEALHDLDSRLQKKPYCARLNVLYGQPTMILPELYKKWNVKKITFQASQVSSESMKHDGIIKILSEQQNVQAVSYFSHTLYDPANVIALNNGRVPLSYKEFRRLMPLMGKPASPIPEPHPMSLCMKAPPSELVPEPEGKIPKLQDLGLSDEFALYTNSWVGGETEALSRLSSFCSRRAAIPNEPVHWLMSKDTLSPYIKFGCLSVRQLFSQLLQFASTSSKGQELFELLTKNLLLREFAFLVGSSSPKFDVMEGNSLCIQLPWESNNVFIQAFRNGQTGYPWIDAIIRQIRQDGWAHFLARQSIAVFLTRGYLWISWVLGKEFFQEFMIDFELPVSSVCWMQSSCSGFFCTQIESYDPCLVGKQIDTDGHYIKTYVPELKDFPSEYVHQPWKCSSLHTEASWLCDREQYPKPIIDVCKQGELCCKRVQSIMKALADVYGVE